MTTAGNPRNRDPWKRTRWAAAAGAALLLSLLPPGLDRASAAPPAPGQGLAVAQAAKVDPKAGGLSIGIAFGQATANHQNQVSKAISTATFMGVVGTTLAAQQCDGGEPTYAREKQPQPLIVDSRDEDAADGKSVRDYGGMFEKYGRASDDPYAEAVTTIGPFDYLKSGSSYIKTGAMVSRSTSGLVDDVREARATVDIGFLEMGGFGRSMRLNGLHWEAVYRSAGDKQVDGKFTIGSATIDGTDYPTYEPSDVLTQANTLLAPLGLKLVPGKTHVRDDMVIVEPLSITVVPHRDRDAAAAAVFDATHSGREELFTRILKEYCRAGTYISVFDIVVGSITGAGEFVVSLGGAQAFSGELIRPNFNLDPGKSGTVGGGFEAPGREASVTVYATTGPTYAAGGPVAGPVAASPTTPASPAQRTQLAGATQGGQPLPQPFEGSRGGALAVVGIVTLAVVALVAEGDRRKMLNARYRAALAASARAEGGA